MTGLQPETPDASTSERNGTGRAARLLVAEAARAAASMSRLLVAEAARAAARHVMESGVVDGIAAALRESPLEAETEVRDMAFIMARLILAEAYERPAGHGGTVEAGGETCRKADATTGRAMTLVGEVLFQRSRYRPSGPGASVVPAGSGIGLTEGGLTPAAASLSMCFISALPARGSGEAWERTSERGLRRPALCGFQRRPAAVWMSVPASFWRNCGNRGKCPGMPFRCSSASTGSCSA